MHIDQGDLDQDDDTGMTPRQIGDVLLELDRDDLMEIVEYIHDKWEEQDRNA